MAIETLKDVLHWTREFHQHLSQCLSNCSDKNTDERARMLLAYLSVHEKTLTDVVTGFEQSGEQGVLNTWCYDYVEHQPITQNVHLDAPFSDLKTTQIMEVIVDQHKQVIELYRYLASRADTTSARELLEALRSLEEHEVMRMVQSFNRFEDL